MSSSVFPPRAQEVKVVLLGDMWVGKSSLAMRFVAGEFKDHLESTIGASFMSKVVNVDDQTIKFQIWDTAGMEKYHSLAPMYYRGAAAAVIVYDITTTSSFTTMKQWVSELQEIGPDKITVAIAGNKCDLPDRKVSYEEGKAFADSIGALFVETSAKEDTNVSEMFIEIGRRLPKASPATGRDRRIQPAAESKKSGCC